MKKKKEAQLKQYESYDISEESDESDFEEKREQLREKIKEAEAKGDKALVAKLRGDLQALERTRKFKNAIAKSGVGEAEFVRRRDKGLKTRLNKRIAGDPRYGKVAESIEEAVMVLNLKKGPVEPQSGPSGPCDCCGKTPCECEKEEPKKVEDDPRMARNKARAMGLKMSYEPEGDLVDEGSCGSSHSKPKKKKLTTEEVEQIDEVLGKIAGKVGGKLLRAAGKFVDKQIASTTAKSVAKAKPRVGGAKVVYKPSSKPSTVKYGGNTPAAKPAEAPKRLASVKDVADDPWTKGAISRDDVMRARRDMRAAQGK